MRILMLAPQIPYPPRQGTSLRNYHILLGLNRNHSVSLMTFIEDSTDAAIPKQLSFCETIEQVNLPARTLSQRFTQLLTSKQPDIYHRLRSELFDKQLQAILNNAVDDFRPYDVVQVEGLELASRIPLIRRLSSSSKILFDSHNAETELQRRAMVTDLESPARWPMAAYSWFQVRRLKRFETAACRAADWVTAVSEADAYKLRDLAPETNLTVVPNCIDVSAYDRHPNDTAITNDLVFVGKMDYRPNVDAVLWFANEIWPIVQQQRPRTTWAIVGQKPHSRLDWIGNLKNVSLTGWVDRVQPYLFGASLVVMPFRIGSGTRLKLIEAMASGRAVVSTKVGAEGYPVQHEREIVIADDPDEFAATILRLLDNPAKRTELEVAAGNFARKYDWRRITQLFDDIYQNI